jgi:hypothetical protein
MPYHNSHPASVTFTVIDSAMARARIIPNDIDWLRQHLHRYGINVPFGVTPAEVEAIIIAIPSNVWVNIGSAWRQKTKRRESRIQGRYNIAQTEMKQLGGVWEQLISMGCVTREDALILAENAYDDRIKAYADPVARALIQTLLHNQAESLRDKEEEQMRQLNRDLARQARDTLCITDPTEIATRIGLPLGDVLEGLEGR